MGGEKTAKSKQSNKSTKVPVRISEEWHETLEYLRVETKKAMGVLVEEALEKSYHHKK